MYADNIPALARTLHFSSIVFDTHTDTPQRFFFDNFDLANRDSEGCVDIPRMREGGIGAIVFALWVPVEIVGPAATRRALDLMETVHGQVRRHTADLVIANSADEIRNAHAEGKIAVLMGVEGGHAINNDLGVLREFRSRGVRYMTLTHNAATDWADSSNAPPRHNGLTEFGREVVREMNRLGMMVDISHVSDRTFSDVLEVSSSPVIASHSCCRAICNAPRNLTDGMIKELAMRGGVIHITFHNAFLSEEYATANKSLASEWPNSDAVNEKYGQNEARKLVAGQRLSDDLIRAGKLPQVSWMKIVEHIDHAVQLAGVDHVGLGSDFDGAFMPEGMEDASKFPKITEALLQRGYPESGIRKILGENTLRVIAETEQVSQALRKEKG